MFLIRWQSPWGRVYIAKKSRKRGVLHAKGYRLVEDPGEAMRFYARAEAESAAFNLVVVDIKALMGKLVVVEWGGDRRKKP